MVICCIFINSDDDLLPLVKKCLPACGGLFDSLWARRKGESAALPSARAMGNVGKLTLGVLPRSEYARHAVLCSLVSFIHPELYDADLSGDREIVPPAGGALSRSV